LGWGVLALQGFDLTYPSASNRWLGGMAWIERGMDLQVDSGSGDGAAMRQRG
jgi:hypothetical protein